MKKIITAQNAPAALGPYSHAVAVGDLLFTSGQLGMDPATGKLAGENIEAQAEQALKNLESVKLFDIFSDEKLGAGKKSMAYTLTFRHAERTLTDNEINGVYEKLRERLARELGVELR